MMEWFERQCDTRAGEISQDHPAIEAIQSCATFIRRRGLNTTLLTTDVRKVHCMALSWRVLDVDLSGQWAELKQLGGIGATALTKDQLDQIPMQRLATWYPQPGDKSPATLRALQAEHPSHYLDSNKGFMASLPAECRSLVSAVLYVRLGKMAVHMETIEKAVWYEIKQRIRLETIPLEYLYRRRPSSPTETRSSRKSTSGKSISSKRSKSRSRHSSRQEDEPEQKEPIPDTMVEGVDYF
jgi:hypothetical protein